MKIDVYYYCTPYLKSKTIRFIENEFESVLSHRRFHNYFTLLLIIYCHYYSHLVCGEEYIRYSVQAHTHMPNWFPPNHYFAFFIVCTDGCSMYGWDVRHKSEFLRSDDLVLKIEFSNYPRSSTAVRRDAYEHADSNSFSVMDFRWNVWAIFLHAHIYHTIIPSNK